MEPGVASSVVVVLLLLLALGWIAVLHFGRNGSSPAAGKLLRAPFVGLGTGRLSNAAAYSTVLKALTLGYRHFDTSESYYNEEGIGRAVRDSGVPRSEITIITKYMSGCGFGTKGDVLSHLQGSLAALGMSYVDVYLVHLPVGVVKNEHGFWTSPRSCGMAFHMWWPDGGRTTVWKGMEEALRHGLVRHIGVANWGICQLQSLEKLGLTMPSVYQGEWHPGYHSEALRKYLLSHRVVQMAYGSIIMGSLSDDRTVATIAEKLNTSQSHVLLRFALEHGISVIPGSTSRSHLAANLAASAPPLVPTTEMQRLSSLSQNPRPAYALAGIVDDDRGMPSDAPPVCSAASRQHAALLHAAADLPGQRASSPRPKQHAASSPRPEQHAASSPRAASKAARRLEAWTPLAAGSVKKLLELDPDPLAALARGDVTPVGSEPML